MIGHVVYGYQFLLLTGDDAGDVFLKFVVIFGFNEILSAFDGEHDMDVNLRVGVGHTRKMSLLTELGNLFSCGFYKDVAPMVLPLSRQHLRLSSPFYGPLRCTIIPQAIKTTFNKVIDSAEEQNARGMIHRDFRTG
jgi:hypothetical protein